VYRSRIIPCLLLQGNGLVKTKQFKDPFYLGDPINIVKLFNDKEVDELIILDIGATRNGTPPDVDRLREIASEAFMPLCYGGGIQSCQQAEALFAAGFEKIAINTATFTQPDFIVELARCFGRQSVIVSIDVKKDWRGRPRVVRNCGRENTDYTPADWAMRVVDAGAGEIFLNSVDRDGCRSGYDLETIKFVTRSVQVPVVVCGGAGNISHFGQALQAGASAVAAGSMFVLNGPHRAVLISYLKPQELDRLQFTNSQLPKLEPICL
jgi:cyclase